LLFLSFRISLEVSEKVAVRAEHESSILIQGIFVHL
jgi:hypothetical protein